MNSTIRPSPTPQTAPWSSNSRHQIGNAVTVPIVCVLAGALLAHLDHPQGAYAQPGLAPALELVCAAMDEAQAQALRDRAVRLPDGTAPPVAALMAP